MEDETSATETVQYVCMEEVLGGPAEHNRGRRLKCVLALMQEANIEKTLLRHILVDDSALTEGYSTTTAGFWSDDSDPTREEVRATMALLGMGSAGARMMQG